MRGTRSAESAGEALLYVSADAMPADAEDLFATANSLFATRLWWRTVMSNAMPDGAAAGFVLCRTNGRATGLFPLLRTSGARWTGFTTPYTCLYTPLIAPDSGPVAVCATFARHCRDNTVTRLDALPEEWPHLDALIAGADHAGLSVRRFAHFGNWHENVGGLGWSGYLASRPGALRETIRRRLRRAAALGDARFTLIDSPDGLEPAIAAFEAVYAKSWKDPEPFPRFNAALIRTAAGMGILRLGIWWIGDQPVATQFWIVEHGHATVLKLAHDDAFKAHSPGTVLTATMLRHLLDRDGVAEIDFGRGDDPYKRDWAAERRQRIGLLLIDPRRPAGLLALLRHDLGRLRARLSRSAVSALPAGSGGNP
jgi:CelD/BcsL family acetyltransferase involved in cellulose biosynthesis